MIGLGIAYNKGEPISLPWPGERWFSKWADLAISMHDESFDLYLPRERWFSTVERLFYFVETRI